MANQSYPSMKQYLVAAVCLPIVLGLMVLVYETPIGVFSVLILMLLACLNATIVAVVFMHLRWSAPLMRLFVLGGLLWFLILIGLTLTDYMTREPHLHVPGGPDFNIQSMHGSESQRHGDTEKGRQGGVDTTKQGEQIIHAGLVSPSLRSVPLWLVFE